MTQLSGRTDKFYSEVVVGKKTQKVYKLTVTSRDYQTGETIKEIMKSLIHPAEIRCVLNLLKH